MKADHPTVELLICLCTFATFPAIAHKILDKVHKSFLQPLPL
jgi:hypothetical protein